MSVVLINRNNKAGFSIYKCFENFKKYLPLKELFMPQYRISFKNMKENISYVKKNTEKDDILHITGDVHYLLLGLKKRNTILTIHDTVLLDNTSRFSPKWYFYYLFWFYFPCKFVKKIVCISKYTQENLNKYVKARGIQNKTQIIPDPVTADFVKSVKVFNKECPVILHIGTNWNKNLDRVIMALEGIACKLVIVGKISEEIENLLKEKNINFQNKMNLTDAQIVEEYNNCDVVSFPSIYEGFGLPILEGQSVGRIVVTSNIEPHKSVSGGAAIFVDPKNVKSIREGFLTAINNDLIRNEKISVGYENAKQYCEEVVVQQYNSLYKSFNLN